MNLSHSVTKALIKRTCTLSTAESCTGGLLAHTLTNMSGSSAFFKAGFITYANAAKENVLQIPRQLIENHGAVSAPVAAAMAEGVRQIIQTDLGIAITGIAGPTGGTPTKPVGLVFIALASSGKTMIRECQFKGTRLGIKKQAVRTALEMIADIVK